MTDSAYQTLDLISGSYPHRRMALYLAPSALSLPSFALTNPHGSLLPRVTSQNYISPISAASAAEDRPYPNLFMIPLRSSVS